MTLQTPRVSVLLSVYNSDRYLRVALESLCQQTYRNSEILIMDDGSTDQSRVILEEYALKDSRFRIFEHKQNIGLTKSLNELGKYATGEYIVRMDADDVADPSRIEKQVVYLDQHPDVAMVGSCGNYLNQFGEVVGKKILPISDKEIKKRLLKNNQFIHSSLCIRKSILEEVGWYDPSFVRSQDYDLVLRIAARYPVANLPECLISWRVSPSSLSWTSKQQEIDAIRARWKAVMVYGYPFFPGVAQIFLRIGWMCIPQSLKRKRYAS